jgi:DNA-binding transcriptional regulator YhcF (GntR family)
MKASDGFVRDPNNHGAVLNTDNAALQAYKQQKAYQKKINTKIDDIDNLKGEVKEIKQMLNLILERLK